MVSIDDSVFGKLTFNGTWVKQSEVVLLDEIHSVEFLIEGNDEMESIRTEQQESYLHLPDSIPKVEDAIFEYYQDVCIDYRSRFGSEADDRMPRICEKKELSRLIRLTGVLFPMVLRDGQLSLSFLFECSWDTEHGLGVRMTDDNYVVGTQDIVT